MIRALALTFGAALCGQHAVFDVTPIQVDEAERIRNALLRDVNGDGLADLVMMIGGSRSRGLPRSIAVFHQRRAAPAFPIKPDWSFELLRDIGAYALADVADGGGDEIVLFTAQRVVAVNREDEKVGYTSLAEITFLWQPPSRLSAFTWQDGVRDVDGDGLADLIVPEPGGFRVLFQRRAAGEVGFDSAVIAVPKLPADRRKLGQLRFERQQGELGLQIGAGRPAPMPLLTINDTLPSPSWIDWEGDGDLDLFVLQDRRLKGWLNAGRGFPDIPTFDFELPRERRLVGDPTFFADFTDLNGDRKADLILVTSRTDEGEPRSRVEIFLQGVGDGTRAKTADAPLFGPKGRANDQLRLDGFTDRPRLDDIDGDGLPELLIGTLDPDLIGTLTSGVSAGVEVDLNVFLNETRGDRQRFARPIAMSKTVRIPASGLTGSRVVARFVIDANRDGTRDLLLRVEETTLELRPVTLDDGQLSDGDPLDSLKIGEEASVLVFDDLDPTELLVIDEQQVLHVRMKR